MFTISNRIFCLCPLQTRVSFNENTIVLDEQKTINFIQKILIFPIKIMYKVFRSP